MTTPVITTIVRNPKRIVIQATFVSAGSDDQTNAVLYNSSVQAAANRDQNNQAPADPLNCRINQIWYSTNASAAVITLRFDASTPVPAYSIPKFKSDHADFRSFGGLQNYAGAGKTGNITLTTTGILSGEVITVIMDVSPY